jgi:RNA polymerase sigma-70 factor (ECF subfamily)
MLLMERSVPRLGPTDAELVDRVLRGDHGAFTDVVRRHDDRLRGLAYKLLGGDRERMDDVLQDAYIRAYRALDTFRRDAHLGSWLYRIVYNACIDELRRGGRRPAPVDVTDAAWDRPHGEPGPERTVTNADAARRALAALPDEQRITVVMVDGEGLDNRTVAALLDVAPGTVASRLSRARATMRRHLGLEAVEDLP